MAPIRQFRIGHVVAQLCQPGMCLSGDINGKDRVLFAMHDEDGQVFALTALQEMIDRGMNPPGHRGNAGENVRIRQPQNIGKNPPVRESGEIYAPAVHRIAIPNLLQHGADGAAVQNRVRRDAGQTNSRPGFPHRLRGEQHIALALCGPEPRQQIVVLPAVAAVEADNERPFRVWRVVLGYV